MTDHRVSTLSASSKFSNLISDPSIVFRTKSLINPRTLPLALSSAVENSVSRDLLKAMSPDDRAFAVLTSLTKPTEASFWNVANSVGSMLVGMRCRYISDGLV